jgi:hypothetical protein
MLLQCLSQLRYNVLGMRIETIKYLRTILVERREEETILEGLILGDQDRSCA